MHHVLGLRSKTASRNFDSKDQRPTFDALVDQFEELDRELHAMLERRDEELRGAAAPRGHVEEEEGGT